MIDTIITALLNGYTYVKKHPQLLFTVLLVLIIPISFLISGQQFLNVAKQNQETLELERLGVLHDTFSSILHLSNFESDVIQRELERTVSGNADIINFIVAREEVDHVRVIASNDRTLIDTIDINPEPFRATHINPQIPISIASAERGIRYWNTYHVTRAESGETYYVYVRTTLKDIDRVLGARVVHAYYWLFGILTIVLLLLLRHVRLIDYAYLYSETKKANEMKDLFTNMIAHELRAPLTAMRGYASIIREESKETATQQHALKIQDASARLVMVVNDLLDIARIHSGKLTVTPTKINIVPIIVSAIESLRVSAEEKTIILNFEHAMETLVILVDEKRFFQAITNLVSNAIKYTKAGTIAVSLIDLSDRVEIRVKDTGMGIAAEDQKHLFMPFFRAGHDETKSITGTGLGMWITKQLIELMNGSVGVESIKGVGTHVVLTLPK